MHHHFAVEFTNGIEKGLGFFVRLTTGHEHDLLGTFFGQPLRSLSAQLAEPSGNQIAGFRIDRQRIGRPPRYSCLTESRYLILAVADEQLAVLGFGQQEFSN